MIKLISIISILSCLGAIAKNKELPANYSLDKLLKSSPNCPTELSIQKKEGKIEVLVKKGDFSEGTSYGELKKYVQGTIEKKKIRSFVEVTKKTVTVKKYKRKKLFYEEILVKKGKGLIWQIDDKKSKKKSMTCIYN